MGTSKRCHTAIQISDKNIILAEVVFVRRNNQKAEKKTGTEGKAVVARLAPARLAPAMFQ